MPTHNKKFKKIRIMHFGIIHFLAIFSPAAASTCGEQLYIGPDLFLALVFCSYSTDSVALLTCLNTTPWGTGYVPSLGSNLVSEITAETPCALNCIFKFVDSVHGLITNSNFKSKCGEAWGPTSVATFNSQACMVVMYEMLTEFNRCASNGYDIRTGLATTRCLYADFIAILRDFTPYSHMLDLAAAQVPSANYRYHVSAGFSSRLNAFDCGSCFDSLYDSLLLVSDSISSICKGDEKYKAACSSTLLGSVLSSFGVCTGGFSMYTLKPSYCSAQQQAVSADLFRPYRSGVECVHLLQPGNYNPTYDCVGLYNGLVDSPQVPCTTCMISALGNILFQRQPACGTFGAYSQPCIESFTGINGMLAQFQLCAGFKLNTEDPSCFGFEWIEIVSLDAGYFAPLFIAGISQTTFNNAATVIRTDIALRDIESAVRNVTCLNCFNALTADSWFLWSKNATTRTACAPNLFSDTCFFDPGVEKIRNRFKACSGHDLLPETYDRCTNTEIENMSDLAGEIFKIGISSTNADSVKQYIATQVLDAGIVSRSCGICYMFFGSELVKLDDKTKSICDSYYTCTLVTSSNMTQIRQGFFTCAGIEINVSPDTSILVSTTPPPLSVVSFVPLYAGNVTTKGILNTCSFLIPMILFAIVLIFP